jgi:hypothetical protein
VTRGSVFCSVSSCYVNSVMSTVTLPCVNSLTKGRCDCSLMEDCTRAHFFFRLDPAPDPQLRSPRPSTGREPPRSPRLPPPPPFCCLDASLRAFTWRFWQVMHHQHEQTRCSCYAAGLWGGTRLRAAPGGRGSSLPPAPPCLLETGVALASPLLPSDSVCDLTSDSIGAINLHCKPASCAWPRPHLTLRCSDWNRSTCIGKLSTRSIQIISSMQQRTAVSGGGFLAVLLEYIIDIF